MRARAWKRSLYLFSPLVWESVPVCLRSHRERETGERAGEGLRGRASDAMSFAAYKEVFEPTCVKACACGHFTKSKAEAAASTSSASVKEIFVLKGENLLELFEIVQTTNATAGGSAPGSKSTKMKRKLKFNLIRSVTVGGQVNAIETLRGRMRTQRDALVLLSESAQVSVIEYDPISSDAVDGFRTTSLHNYRDFDSVTLARNHAMTRRRLQCDPKGRLCAMMFFSDFVALVPTREHNLDELLKIDDRGEASPSLSADARAPSNRLQSGSDVVSLSEVCKVAYVKDMCFLHGYNEPVLCLLHESSSASRGPTWPGRLRDLKDTCGVKAFSINTQHRQVT